MAADDILFAHPEFASHESVTFEHDAATGLQAIVAVHSTRRGPALGGVRVLPYGSTAEALTDVLRLSRGMTYKAALAGLELGGGKAVVFERPGDRRALMTAFGGLVARLGGRYITAEDVGSTVADMDTVAAVTAHVTGISPSLGGSGDPSPSTAHGVLAAMRAAVAEVLDRDSLAGLHVAIAGVGKVGAALARLLLDDGARLTVADTRPAAVEAVTAYGGDRVAVADPDRVHAVECDVFSPCALGAALGPVTIGELRCALVVGAANNQLADPSCGELLAAREIVYVPDYVANAGGLIQMADEYYGLDWDRVHRRVEAIGGTVVDVLRAARDRDVTPAQAADELAFEAVRSATRAALRPEPVRRALA